jgi:segregation and condensation protein B
MGFLEKYFGVKKSGGADTGKGTEALPDSGSPESGFPQHEKAGETEGLYREQDEEHADDEEAAHPADVADAPEAGGKRHEAAEEGAETEVDVKGAEGVPETAVPAEEETQGEDEESRAKKLIEAALFMAPGVLTLQELARISHTDLAEARILVNQLMHDYWERKSAVEIRDDDDGIKMAVRQEFDGEVSSLAAVPGMHKGLTMTLAFIAYKQPVRQAEVIRFRNTKAYDHIKLLEQKGFIRREKIKNSYTIYTTRKFHDYFGKIQKGKHGEIEGIGEKETGNETVPEDIVTE